MPYLEWFYRIVEILVLEPAVVGGGWVDPEILRMALMGRRAKFDAVRTRRSRVSKILDLRSGVG